jgi:uncharacterized protein (TIGR02246 family)
MAQIKSLILSFILFSTFALPMASAWNFSDSSPKAAIRELVQRFDQAINAKDAKAFGKLFAEDGEFTNPVGMSCKGRAAIEQFHAALFEESNRPSFAHAHLTIEDTTIRLIRPDVAAVDVKWEQTGAIDPEGKPWGTRRGILSWVVGKDNGQWLIQVWHNLELPAQH